LAELVAAGFDHPNQLCPHHFMRRLAADRIVTYAEIYASLAPGELLSGTREPRFAEAWRMAQPHSFQPAAAPSPVSAMPRSEPPQNTWANA
jgi:hypothetical protein